ncbi:hypothetical protein BCV69DRAFT_270447 [Microstroma glucosiphilum]|uniref:Uncharacterized protein n=1 Tax=Pseudomicrostroma glucosiphilum TaxID=1684307 RepID=A0A316UCK2_9BASI|nr:hypothetical protein BCV69DRAFT_270447 [Pseudomicrostroma glucosiphilum]PWN20755.1 hypothetical protein BCV69DRAFT_270447 [Pseudomicrostroma glucosiphilum]
MSSANTTDSQFKKTEQTIGENGGQVTDTGKGINDDIFKTRAPGNAENFAAEPESNNSKIERDLAEKGYSNRTTDETLEEASELKAKLDKRGNPAQ